MDRRRFLATTGAALAPSVAGCLGGRTDDRSDDADRDRTTAETTGARDGVHDLFVENHTSTTETAWIGVVREDGARLVDGRYELPDERGLEFESIAAWETAYTIELAIDGEDATSLEWYTKECGPGSEAPGDSGSRNAFVRVQEPASEDGRVSMVRDECDALHGPAVPVGPAESFRLDE